MTFEEAEKNDKFFYLKLFCLMIIKFPRYLFNKMIENYLQKNNGIVYFCNNEENKAIVLVNRGKINNFHDKAINITIPSYRDYIKNNLDEPSGSPNPEEKKNR